MEKFLISKGWVKNHQEANFFMVGLTIICVCMTLFLMMRSSKSQAVKVRTLPPDFYQASDGTIHHKVFKAK